MPFVARSVTIMKDGFAGPLDWNVDVVGGSVVALNVQVLAQQGPFPTAPFPPAAVQVAVTHRVPNNDVGLPSISQPLLFDVPLVDAAPVATADGLGWRYRRAIMPGELTQTASVLPPPTLTYATLAREGGTSDAHFRGGMSGATIAPRGRAVQPSVVGARTGVKGTGTPDAQTLLFSGGLEVVDCTFVPSFEVGITPLVALPSDSALVQSPANVFYYTGHGLGASNCFALEVPVGSHHFQCWAFAPQVVHAWQPWPAMSVLVVAGCSVLGLNTEVSPMAGPGLGWVNLLRVRGGPFTAMLGYGTWDRESPLDAHGGNEIGAAIGQRIAAGSASLAEDWLHINADKHAWNACAWDGTGRFWWIGKPHLPVVWSVQSQQVV
jgi:hypothetical protein